MLLDSIDQPSDLRDLTPDQLDALATEIRDHIVTAVSANGGHLGSNLGAVELTLAVHRVFEVGASAGLNLRWDRFWYDTGATTFGDPDSGVRFVGWWEGEPADRPDLSTGAEVAEREGCDRNPLDPTTEDGRTTLRSYVWPDQTERFARLDAALAIAARLPAPAESCDAQQRPPALQASRHEGAREGK